MLWPQLFLNFFQVFLRTFLSCVNFCQFLLWLLINCSWSIQPATRGSSRVCKVSNGRKYLLSERVRKAQTDDIFNTLYYVHYIKVHNNYFPLLITMHTSSTPTPPCVMVTPQSDAPTLQVIGTTPSDNKHPCIYYK